MAKFGPMVESCSTLPSFFVFFRFCQSVKLALCRTFDFAVLPECRSCPRISLRRFVLFGTLVQFAVVAILRWRTYPIQTVIRFLDVEPAECFWEKQKEPITQSTKNRRERGSRFKMMFYVIGSEDQSRVLLSYCSRQQNQRRGGAVRYFRSVPMLCRIAPTSLLWIEHFYSVVM